MALSGLHKASSREANGCDVSDLELLAHYELVEEGTGRARSGFAVLLELSERRLLLEGDVSFKPGDTLDLNFFLPDSGSDMGRTKISLRCAIADCRDLKQLHYNARISKIADRSKQAIEKLHAERSSGDKS